MSESTKAAELARAELRAREAAEMLRQAAELASVAGAVLDEIGAVASAELAGMAATRCVGAQHAALDTASKARGDEP